MQQNNKTVYLKLYIPGGNRTPSHRYNSISPNNMQFQTFNNKPVLNHQYRLSRYQPLVRKLGKQSPKSNFGNSMTQTLRANNKEQRSQSQHFSQTKQSLSRMLQESGNIENYNWHKIYKFYTKSKGGHRLMKSKQSPQNMKKSKELGKVLKVAEIKPSFFDNKKRYMATPDARCRCHQKSHITCTPRDISSPQQNYTHHRFVSTSHSKRKRIDCFKDNHLSRQQTKQNGPKFTQTKPKITVLQNWTVDQWKTNSKYSQMGQFSTF